MTSIRNSISHSCSSIFPLHAPVNSQPGCQRLDERGNGLEPEGGEIAKHPRSCLDGTMPRLGLTRRVCNSSLQSCPGATMSESWIGSRTLPPENGTSGPRSNTAGVRMSWFSRSRRGPTVEFALETITQPIGVSTSHVTRELPAPHAGGTTYRRGPPGSRQQAPIGDGELAEGGAR